MEPGHSPTVPAFVPSIRRMALKTARKLGVENGARRVVRAFGPWHARRNWDDDQQLRRLIRLGLSSDSHCVDIGANEGVILGWIVDAAPIGRHIAFEPVPFLNEKLRRRHPAVDVREEAVSDHAGSAEFTVVRTAPSRSGLAPLGVPSGASTDIITVPVVRLDDVIPEGFHPRLIKLDVEGTELSALRGARSTIAEHDVLVAFEHGHGQSAPDPATSAALFDLLCGDLRLRVFDMRGNEFDQNTFRQVYLDGSCWNFLARR